MGKKVLLELFRTRTLDLTESVNDPSGLYTYLLIRR